MTPVRVAIWGLGRHAISKLVPAVRAAQGLSLHGVCSRDAAQVSACAESAACKAWTDLDAMLKDPDVDVVYVATPIGLHAEHGRRVLGAGKHLWCEKPLTSGLEDTQELIRLASNRNRSICEGLMYLYHPQFRRLAAYVDEAPLGRLRSISCRFGIPRMEHSGFRSDPRLGGGAFLDVGCYPLSAILALLGDQELHVRDSAIEVAAGSAVDTSGHALIEARNGVIAYAEWAIHCAYRNEIDLWCEGGSVFADRIFSKAPDHVPAFVVRDLHGSVRTESAEANNHFVSMLEQFRRIIGSPQDTEQELVRIKARARLMDRIKLASRSDVAQPRSFK
jgi:NDP-hexose-3-ketoreductase